MGSNSVKIVLPEKESHHENIKIIGIFVWKFFSFSWCDFQYIWIGMFS